MLKRSEINWSIEIAKKVFAALGLRLPPFAYWTVKDWSEKGHEADGIRNAMLGWDVTDFGRGRFETLGRTLFTLRNGYRKEDGTYSQIYAEKLILDPPNQCPPLHFHRSKMEDIVVRGGGNICVLLYKADAEDNCSDEDLAVQINGMARQVKAGEIVRLTPGESINMRPYIIHQFWGEEGTGIDVNGVRYTVSGEVSSVCDDWNDNVFLEQVERFPSIEEDEPRDHYLCNEYPAAP